MSLKNRYKVGTAALVLTICSCPLQYAVATTPASKVSNVPFTIDARVNGTKAFKNSAAARPGALAAAMSSTRSQLATSTTALATLTQKSPNVRAHYSQLTGGLSELIDTSGWLTSGASPASSESIVRSYLGDQAQLFGLSGQDLQDLNVLGDSSGGGLRMLRIEQRVAGLPVFQSESHFLLSHDGRLAKYVGQLVPNAHASAQTIASSAWISPGQAVADLLAFEGKPASAGAFKSTTAADGRVTLTAGSTYVKGNITARQMWFPLAPGVLVPAWSLIVFTHGEADWNAVVDAQTGDVLWRKNMRAHASTQDARFSVYVQADGTTPADSPAPHSPTDAVVGAGTQYPGISRTIVSMHTAMSPTASPNGWINDGQSTSQGNNVTACLDTDADDTCDTGIIDNNGMPIGNPDVAANNRDFLGNAPRDYTYQPAPLAGNPDAGDSPGTATYQRGIITNLFYTANWYHDQLYALGFDEAAGNFQATNFSGMGTGGDPVNADGDDGSGTDNSNFSTPPDGQSGRMQMYIFDFPTPERDGSLDGEVMLHELTHGTSNRLIGDGNGLIWDAGGGMGEGWSDFYSLSLLNNTNADDPNGSYAFGAYVTYQFLGLTDNYVYGIRRFPYSTNHNINPLTWADVDDVTIDLTNGSFASSPLGQEFGGALEVHNIGEVWASTLWDVRALIIADPTAANGDVPTGNHTMLQLTTDALKMTPINPSFIDARDALIDADCAANACANETSIWSGFAGRGLGYGAVGPSGQVGIEGAGGYAGIGESFAAPNLDVQSIAIDDSAGNNNGAIDQGETIHLTVTLKNPWRNASRGVASATATLSSSTLGVSIGGASANYGAIAAQGSVAGASFAFTVPSSATCGEALHFTMTIASALGTTTRDIVLRVGADAGDGAPITYTRTVPSGGLPIPDDDLRGVSDTLTIADDKEIDNMQFSIDNLLHTWTGDLAVALKGPNGYGSDMAYRRGFFIGDSNGDNFVNTVFDDASSNDLNLSGSANAPYTGTWAPAFNSPIWSLFGIPNLGPDPVGQLSRFNGLSTSGMWTVHVTDESQEDTGTLKAWSLIVTPKAFTCTAPSDRIFANGFEP